MTVNNNLSSLFIHVPCFIWKAKWSNNTLCKIDWKRSYWVRRYNNWIRGTLLSCAVLYRATQHSTELRRTLLSCTEAYTELRRTLLSYTAAFWATLHSTELHRTLLIYAAPYWATPHSTVWATPHSTELRRRLYTELHRTLLGYAALSIYNNKNGGPYMIIINKYADTIIIGPLKLI
jgi:hypothetical protein